MLLRQIKYFVTVVDTGSFTEAAEECYISQSAISQQILTLEKELGVQLLIRNTRRFTLTDAGKYLYSHGKLLLGEMEKLKNGTINAAKSSCGHLSIAYLNGCANKHLYKAIGAFKQHNAEVEVHVSGAGYEEISALLRSGKADIVFGVHRHIITEEYEQQLLASVPCYVEMSAVFGGFENGRVDINELEQIPCIFVADEKQRAWEREYYTKLLGFNGEFLFARSMEEAHLMAAAGSGALLIDNNREAPGGSCAVRVLPLCRNNVQLEKKYYLFWKKDNVNKCLQEFIRASVQNFDRCGGQNGDL